MQNIKGKSFLKIIDFNKAELNLLLNMSHQLKREKYSEIENKVHTNKSICLIFQKDSTRTRCAFEVAAHGIGMSTVYIGPEGSQFGKKESVEDSAKVLGRMFDGILFRGYKQSDVEELSKYSGVPVWNGLTDDWHPTQMIADFMTIQEEFGMDLSGIKITYVGDGRNNVAKSLMVMSAKMGVNLTILSPKKLFPPDDIVKLCKNLNIESGGSVKLETDWKVATKNTHVIYTDVWVSMGEDDWENRLSILKDYQVNMKMFDNAHKDAIFLHCLPSFHDKKTEVGYKKAEEYGDRFPKMKNGEIEVTNEVFSSIKSRVFDQAENRLHSIKAIVLATIG